MQRFAVNYYKDGREEATYAHVIECESVEQALQISRMAAVTGEHCVLLTADPHQFGMYEELRAAVLELADEIYEDAKTRMDKISFDDAEYNREGGIISGLSMASGKMFDLLRRYR